MCKVLESIIRDKITEHMKNNYLFSQQQFGFLAKRSTVLQLIKVLDIWTEIIDQGGSIDAIYMDFMKAFDKVPHKRLLHKIEKYGIQGNVLGWIKSFLSSRTQSVIIKNTNSKVGKVTSGIPQGSVLGPLLFVIYINDLPEVVDDHTFVFLFADDTKLFRQINSAKDIHTLNSDIRKLIDWSDKWLLRFHPDKCIAMNLGRDFLTEDRIYDMNGQELKKTDCEKDLGVFIDRDLKFDKHIAACVSKANKIFAIINKTFDYMDAEMFKMLFKSLVRPHLEYAAPIWSPHHEYLKTSIERVQKRATKRIPGFHDLSYPERLRKLSMPTLAYRRVRGDMINVYKLVHGLYDTNIPGIFKQNLRDTQGHPRRIRVKGSKKDTRKYSFGVRTINLWNSLTKEIVEAKDVKTFEIALDEKWKSEDLYYNNYKSDIRLGILSNTRYQDFTS